MTQPRYPTADAFKQALEQRLRTASRDGIDFARRRQLLVFDRFLARVAVSLGDAATLKGGLVLELRLQRARTTRRPRAAPFSPMGWHASLPERFLGGRPGFRRGSVYEDDAS